MCGSWWVWWCGEEEEEVTEKVGGVDEREVGFDVF